MKSALTAAISSGGDAPTPSAAPTADTFSFPALRDPSAELSAQEQESLDAARKETQNFTPVGSMPTSDVAAGMVSLLRCCSQPPTQPFFS
jgi:hypothetical protein